MGTVALLQAAEVSWAQVLVQVPVLLQVAICGVILWKLAPTWEKRKASEDELKRHDIEARTESARASAAVAHALESVAGSLEAMTADHRRLTETTDELRLFLRVATKENRRLDERVTSLEHQRVAERA